MDNSAVLQAIDGHSIREGKRGVTINNTREIEFAPGSHTVTISYICGSGYGLTNVDITVEVKAGHQYELHVAKLKQTFSEEMKRSFFGGRFYWTWWVIDTADGKVVAGNPRKEPKECGNNRPGICITFWYRKLARGRCASITGTGSRTESDVSQIEAGLSDAETLPCFVTVASVVSIGRQIGMGTTKWHCAAVGVHWWHGWIESSWAKAQLTSA